VEVLDWNPYNIYAKVEINDQPINLDEEIDNT